MCSNILHPIRVEELAKSWLLEDASHFDWGGGVVAHENEFVIYMKSSGILAGNPFCNAVFNLLGLKAEWYHEEGDWIDPISEIAKIRGPSNKLLLSERIVLNVLSRASGVATATSKMCNILKQKEWKGSLAGTRKTTPGFRMVEKYSLLIGGADMHRYDLSSMVMLKDNHVSIAGSVPKAIEKVRKLCGFSMKIEVECRSLKDAIDAANGNCDIIMLDNFKSEDLQKTSSTLKQLYPAILIEASGGINADNVGDYACPDVDIISSSSLVQGYPAVDFSMKFFKHIKSL